MTVKPLKRRRAARGSGDHLREEILDATTGLLLETGHEYGELRGIQIEAEADIHRDVDAVFECARELTLRYASGISSLEGDAAAALRAQARKRVAVRFEPKRTATWDHRKLGGSY